MDPAKLIQTHGYWALALGCLLEGESLLVLAGFAAHQGYLQLPWVIAVAAAAGFAGDQLFFWLGRRHGNAALARLPSLPRQSARVHRLIESHPSAFVIGMRFAYGMRIAAPIVAGSSRLPADRFAALNAVGAVLWAVAIAGLGRGLAAARQRCSAICAISRAGSRWRCWPASCSAPLGAAGAELAGPALKRARRRSTAPPRLQPHSHGIIMRCTSHAQPARTCQPRPKARPPA